VAAAPAASVPAKVEKKTTPVKSTAAKDAKDAKAATPAKPATAAAPAAPAASK
jgi:hypothetical protein